MGLLRNGLFRKIWKILSTIAIAQFRRFGVFRNSPQDGRGMNRSFTLVELLLVILILAIIVSLSVPNLTKSYYKIVLNQTVNDIVYLMRYAQSRAIIQRTVFKFVLNPEQKRYYVEEKISEEEDIDAKKGFRAVPGRFGKFFSISEDISVVAEPQAVQFQPNGKIDKAIYTLCCKKRCQTISTKEQSGYVAVLKDSESYRSASN